MWVKDVEWHREAEVVVLGYGGAGAIAAMTAHDAGASVLIIEKQAENDRHPNTAMAGGSFICPSDPEAAYEHMKLLYQAGPDLYETDPEVLRAWAYKCSDNLRWVEDNGGSVTLYSPVGEHHKVPGYESIQGYRFATGDHPSPSTLSGYGYGMFLWLQELVAKRAIPAEYGTTAKWLLTDPSGAVIGVQASRGGEVFNVRATRAVILTTGGFEFNDKLKLDHLRVFPTHFYGSPDNTGDGVIMAQEVGAALTHMSSASGKAIAKFPDFETGFAVNFWGYGEGLGLEHMLNSVSEATANTGALAQKDRKAGCGAMQVDRSGRRFTNEVWKQHTQYYELTGFDSQLTMYPRVPCYWIFDSARMARGQLVTRDAGAAGPLKMYDWSEDNLKELERGWIVKADTIDDLARELEMEPDTLSRTLQEYNSGCQTGVDPLGLPPTGRHPSTLVALEAPFYAMRLWPGGPNTQGGPERNARAQVMRVTGEPIPGLYSAGELGSIFGMLYPLGGGNLAECIAFGRIAGENASKEPVRVG
jgi:succinate dehydrogenase/fumarate reductase flavoprotein subunit